jgi:hypothetical protein
VVGNKARNIWQQMLFFTRQGFAAQTLRQMYALRQGVGKYHNENYAKAVKFLDLLESPMSERRILLNRDLKLRTIWYQDIILKYFLYLGIPQRVLKLKMSNLRRKTTWQINH